MSTEDTNQVTDELFDHQAPESDPELESTTEEETPSEEIKHNIAEDNRQKQIQTFLNRVKSGEMTVEEIPHKWIKSEVEKLIPTKNTQDAYEIARQVVREEKEAEKYTSLRAKLNDANLTEDKRSRVSEEYQDLIKDGVPKAKALEKAIAIVGVKLDDYQRYAARLPKVSNAKANPDDHIKESLNNNEMPEVAADDRLAYWEKLRKQTNK
jgi:hypothetical protein